MEKVIISGGSGLVGSRLKVMLKNKGYEVRILSRHPRHADEYYWNIEKGEIDARVFEEATAIIHLAGAGVAEERWTEARKKEILDSRIRPAALLHDHLSGHPHRIQTFLSASAVGYYGDRGEQVLTEETPAGTGFLPDVCRAWETAAETFKSLQMRVAEIRIGIVLSNDGGALPKMDLPVKLGLGAYIGNGKQFVPWIHIDDLCGIFMHLLQTKDLEGPFNACAPGILNNKALTRAIAHALHRPFIPMPAPAFLLNTAMGEMAAMVLMSTNCSSKKIMDSGFHFRYPDIDEALRQLYSA